MHELFLRADQAHLYLLLRNLTCFGKFCAWRHGRQLALEVCSPGATGKAGRRDWNQRRRRYTMTDAGQTGLLPDLPRRPHDQETTALEEPDRMRGRAA
jgi:hypothetical protein